MGQDAGNVITDGAGNTIIGTGADASASGASNQIVIGASAAGNGDNTVTLGNTAITDVYIVNATDDGDAKPTLHLRRDLASGQPGGGDVMGRISFDGADSLGNNTEYARIEAVIKDKDNGSEEGRLDFGVFADDAGGGGGVTNVLHLVGVDAVNQARVGIGLTNPAHILDVVGTAGLSTGTAWTNTSDERIKTNIETIENGLDKINQLRPISFNYSEDYLEQHQEIDSSKKYNSFLAQEYAEVFPDAVSVGGNLEKVIVEAAEGVAEEKEVVVEDMLQFTPHDLNMYLVKAVQELSAKVEELEAKLK